MWNVVETVEIVFEPVVEIVFEPVVEIVFELFRLSRVIEHTWNLA